MKIGNILITSAGRRVSLMRAFKKELQKFNPNGKVIVADAFPELSPAAQTAEISVKIPKIDSPQYLKSLLHICIENDVKLIIPTIDTELEILSKNSKVFLDKGIKILVSDTSFITISSDKRLTHDFFKEKEISSAEIYSKSEYKLPLFIKPINGSSSANNFIIKNKDDFNKDHFSNKDLLFFEYLDHNNYDEYTCDLYYDKNNFLKCAVPRKRLEVRGGEVSKGVTEKKKIVDYIKNKLDYIEGARGCITLQLFVHRDNKSVEGIEINARFGGGYPLSYLAGANYPKWIIEEYFLERDISYFDNWKDNLLMLRYDAEILVENHYE